MTTKEYKTYKRSLEAHGYEFRPDQPYDGKNSWAKVFGDRNGVKASVSMREYDHRDTADRITLGATGVISLTEDVVARMEVHFGYDPDLSFVETKMAEYWDLLSKKMA